MLRSRLETVTSVLTVPVWIFSGVLWLGSTLIAQLCYGFTDSLVLGNQLSLALLSAY